MKNMNNGRMVAKNGPIAVAASSNWGVKANTRYSAAPVPIATGSVQSLMNRIMSIMKPQR